MMNVMKTMLLVCLALVGLSHRAMAQYQSNLLIRINDSHEWVTLKADGSLGFPVSKSNPSFQDFLKSLNTFDSHEAWQMPFSPNKIHFLHTGTDSYRLWGDLRHFGKPIRLERHDKQSPWKIEKEKALVTGTIRLHLRAPDGTPLRQVPIRLLPLRGSFGFHEASRFYLDETTDAQGMVSMPCIPGRYQIRVEVPSIGYGMSGILWVNANTTTEAKLPPLVQYGTLTGTVERGDIPESQEIQATLYMQGMATEKKIYAIGKDNIFRFDNLSLGSASIYINPLKNVTPNFGSAYTTIQASRETEVTAKLALQFEQKQKEAHQRPKQPTSVSGEVKDQQGNPIPNTEVFISYGYSGIRFYYGVLATKTDATGKFIITDLPDYWEGLTAQVIRENGDFGTAQHYANFDYSSTSIKTEKPFFSVVVSPRKETLSLRIVTSKGEPAKNIPVTLSLGYMFAFPDRNTGSIDQKRRLNALLYPTKNTDEFGIVRFSHLSSGTYTVSYQTGEGPETTQQQIKTIPVYTGNNPLKTFRQPTGRKSFPIHLVGVPIEQDNRIEYGYSTTQNSGGGSSATVSTEGIFDFQSFNQGLTLLTFHDKRQYENSMQDSAPKNIIQCILPISYAYPLLEPPMLVHKTIQTGKIEVTIQTSEGKPFAHQPVGVSYGNPGEVGTTDGAGKITFNDIPPGEYNIQPLIREKQGYISSPSIKLSSGETVIQTLKVSPPTVYTPSTNGVYVLPTPKSITVIVLQPDGKTPAANASIAPYYGVTNHEGKAKVTLYGDSTLDTYTISALSMEGFATGTIPISATETTLTLKPQTPLLGTVTITGKSLLQFPSASIDIFLTRQDPTTKNTNPPMSILITPQADGTFSCGNLLPGTYKGRAVMDNIWHSPDVTFAYTGKGDSVTLNLPHPGKSVTLHRAPEETLVWADQPTLIGNYPSHPFEFVADSKGNIQIVGLPAGKQRLRVKGTEEIIMVDIPLYTVFSKEIVLDNPKIIYNPKLVIEPLSRVAKRY
jgi:hypothetical protein